MPELVFKIFSLVIFSSNLTLQIKLPDGTYSFQRDDEPAKVWMNDKYLNLLILMCAASMYLKSME